MTALPLLSSCESELYFYTFIEEAQTKLRVGCGVTTVLTSAEPPVPRVWVEVGWASGIVRFVFYSGLFFYTTVGALLLYCGAERARSSCSPRGEGRRLVYHLEAAGLSGCGPRPSLSPAAGVAVLFVSLESWLAGVPTFLW